MAFAGSNPVSGTNIKTNKMATNSEFNKVLALDELSQIMQVPPNSSISVTINAMIDAQNYLKKIHDNAFAKGFENGCDATKKIDKI